MTREEAIREAEKRERHKAPTLQAKRWEARHSEERGWHPALVDCPFALAAEAHEKARQAFAAGDTRAFMDAAADALVARVRATLSSTPSEEQASD